MGMTVKIVAAGALVCFLAGAAGIYNTVNAGFHVGTAQIDIEKKVPGEAVRKLNVHSDITDITIAKSADKDIHVHMTGSVSERYKSDAVVEATTSGDTAEIDVRMQKHMSFGLDLGEIFSFIRSARFEGPKVEVALPKQTFDSVRLEAATGDIRVPSIQTEDLALKTATGDISVEAFKGRILKADANTGDVKLEHIDSEVSVSTDTGDIEVGTDALTRPMTLTADTGDVNITVNGGAAFGIDFDSDVGKTKAHVTNASFAANEKHRLSGTVGSGGPLVKAHTDVGNIELTTK